MIYLSHIINCLLWKMVIKINFDFIILLKAFFIGLALSFPMGPIGLLCVQRTLVYSRRVGFISWIGAAISDFIYGFIAFRGTNYLKPFLQKKEFLFTIITGIIFLIIGIKTYIYSNKKKQLKNLYTIHPTLSTFMMGISNPMTVIIFLGIFSVLQISYTNTNHFNSYLVLFSIFLGSVTNWFILTYIINKFKRKMDISFFSKIDKVVGLIVSLMGFLGLLKGIILIGRKF